MARKNAARSDKTGDSLLFDTRNNRVMAAPADDGIKEKIQAVREVVPGKSNNEIILVLQYYDNNVEAACQAYLEDGAKMALEQWHYPGNKVASKKKKKSKNKGSGPITEGQKSGDLLSTSSAANHVPQQITKSSAILSDQARVQENNVPSATSKQTMSKESHAFPNTLQYDNKTLTDHKTSSSTHSDVIDTVSLPSKEITVAMTSSAPPPAHKVPGHKVHSAPPPKSFSGPLPQRHRSKDRDVKVADNSIVTGVTMVTQPLRINLPAETNQGQCQRLDELTKERERNPSEQSERSVTSVTSSKSNSIGAKNIKSHPALEKSVKDLQRQTISLQRLRDKMNEETEKAGKRIRTNFEDFRKQLDAREAQLLVELNTIKNDANDVLSKRQEKAVSLKKLTHCTMSMADGELKELRADIKLFVSDRKVDEDICRTTRFIYDPDPLLLEVQRFGEVVPLKALYSTRRPSVSSVSDSIVSQDDLLSPMTPHDVFSPAPGGQISIPETGQGIKGETVAPPGVNPSGPFILQSDTMSTSELADLQLRLQDSLKLQGVPIKEPVRRTPPRIIIPTPHSASSSSTGGNKVSQRPRSGPSNLGQGQPLDGNKSRNAKRRQRDRERDRQRNNQKEYRTEHNRYPDTRNNEKDNKIKERRVERKSADVEESKITKKDENVEKRNVDEVKKLPTKQNQAEGDTKHHTSQPQNTKTYNKLNDKHETVREGSPNKHSPLRKQQSDDSKRNPDVSKSQRPPREQRRNRGGYGGYNADDKQVTGAKAGHVTTAAPVKPVINQVQEPVINGPSKNINNSKHVDIENNIDTKDINKNETHIINGLVESTKAVKGKLEQRVLINGDVKVNGVMDD